METQKEKDKALRKSIKKKEGVLFMNHPRTGQLWPADTR